MPRLSQEVKGGLWLALIGNCSLALGAAGLAAAGEGPVGLRFLFSASNYESDRRFTSPQGLAFDSPRGEIYVADTGNNQVVILSKGGVPIYRFRHWVRDRSGARIPGEPWGVAEGDGGTMMVTDRLSDDIDVVDFRGGVIRTINVTAVLGQKERANPGRMDRDNTGNLYVVEHTSGQVLVFNRHGGLVRSFGGRGKGDGKFEMIADVTVDSRGNAYVLDSRGTPVIQAFDQEGRRISAFGRHGDKPQDFHFPVALALDGAGVLWIADAFSHEVKAYTTSGEFLGVFGEMGTGDGQFYFPSDLVATSGDALYVLEKAGRRLQAFQIVRPQSLPPAAPGKEVG